MMHVFSLDLATFCKQNYKKYRIKRIDAIYLKGVHMPEKHQIGFYPVRNGGTSQVVLSQGRRVFYPAGPAPLEQWWHQPQ
jgi:hypothetical protein